MSDTNFFFDTDLTGRVIRASALKKKDDNEREIKSLTIDIELKCENKIIKSYNPNYADTIRNEDGRLRGFQSIDFGAQSVKNLRFQCFDETGIANEHTAQGVSIERLKVKYKVEDEVEILVAIFTLLIPEDGNKDHVWNIASLIKDEDITFQLSKTQLELELPDKENAEKEEAETVKK